MSFELTSDYINNIILLIQSKDEKAILFEMEQLYPADIAEIFDDLSLDQAIFIYHLLENEISSEVLIEMDDSSREKLIASLSPKEIAQEIIDTLETDDAADVLQELSDEKKEEVISHIEDLDHAKDIIDLLNYEEGTAGSIMAKELVKVNVNWTVATCIREMRKQAEDLDDIHTIYVVDDRDRLKGRLSLKKFLFLSSSTRSMVSDLYEKEDIIMVNAETEDEEVASIMEKYDLVVLPVVNEHKVLLGRITIDDVVDVMVEEAEKDYQMASGISEDVESSDSILTLTRARLPWLLIGMLGGLGGAAVIGAFDISKNLELALFIPLIAAMGGNVGVQSAAIVVQGLANKSIKNEQLFQRLMKEFSVALLNGIICSAILLASSLVLGYDIRLGITVSISLLVVIVFAALFGTFIPLFLDKYKIDPAVATGPFITTANDIFGLIIYFLMGNLIFGIL